jgi:hypothetical protein
MGSPQCVVPPATAGSPFLFHEETIEMALSDENPIQLAPLIRY